MGGYLAVVAWSVGEASVGEAESGAKRKRHGCMGIRPTIEGLEVGVVAIWGSGRVVVTVERFGRIRR
jgi:hypothetical protein